LALDVEVFGVPVLAGRGFTAAGALPGATAVIVDQVFADTRAPASPDVVSVRTFVSTARGGDPENYRPRSRHEP
jgi:hypothetical protein